MKILQLVTRRQHRGAEVAAAMVSQEFVRMGHSVLFAGLYAPPPEPLSVHGATLVDIGATPGFFSIRGFQGLLRLVDREKPDILHANGSDTLKYLVAVKWIRPKAIVIYRNISLISHWLGSNRMKRSGYSFLLRKVDYVTSVGEASREDFLRCFDFSPDRIRVVRRGIPIPDLSLIDRKLTRDELGIPPEKQVVLHVGNFSPEKNHELLLESFSILAKHTTSAWLILVGEGELLQSMKEKAKQLDLREQVRFEGLQKDIAPYLTVADLVVLTSRVEGVPGVLLEAAAYGVPAVAVNVGGVSEAVDSGTTGILVENATPESFSASMQDLLSHEEERVRLGTEAMHVVKEKFDIKRCAAQFLAIFDFIQKRG